MAEVKYIGASLAVDVNVESGARVRVKQGGMLRCSTALAKSLLRQTSSWEKVSEKKDEKEVTKDGA